MFVRLRERSTRFYKMNLKNQYHARSLNVPRTCARKLWHHIRERRDVPADVYRDFRRRMRQNDRYQNTEDGDVYILCTGPSIKGLDPATLVGKTIISVSHFYNHPLCGQVRPKYHLLAANHAPFEFDHYDRYIDGLSKWDWDFTCMFGYYPYAYSPLKYFANDTAPRFDYSFYRADLAHFGDRRSYLLKRAWDFSKTIPSSNTVLIQAIQWAVYIGAKRVILLGCDHDYAENIGAAATPHFYDANKGHDDSKLLNGISTEQWFQILHKRWQSYRYIHDYCLSQQIQVLNATKGSKLDVFPFVNLEQIK